MSVVHERRLIEQIAALPGQADDAAPTQMSPPPNVSVVVPCCNEEESLPQLLAALSRLAQRHGARYNFEFVLVDDGSQDRTGEMLQAAQRDNARIRTVRHDCNRGIAAAIQSGVRGAAHPVVCSLDADCTYDPELLVSMIPMLTDDVDLVTASPYHPLGRVHNVPAWRLALSRGASRLYRLLMKHKLHTYTSCVRVYRRASIIDLSLENDGFSGVAELLWKVERQGGRIVECPATLDVRRYGQSKIRLVQVIWGHIWLLAKVALTSRVAVYPDRTPVLADAPPRQSAPASSSS